MHRIFFRFRAGTDLRSHYRYLSCSCLRSCRGYLFKQPKALSFQFFK